MSTLLAARDLALARAGRTLFTDLELVVSRGDRVGLVGHNGSGKSSLLALLARQEEPDAGTVEHAHAMKLAVVEQFLPDDVAALPAVDAVMASAPAAFRDESFRAEALLAQLGLDDAALALSAGALSGGQQNRLMLARAMIGDPDLLLLDEPTNHLDIATLSVFEAFLQARTNLSWLLVSHDRRFLDRVTNRTVFLRDGRLQAFDLRFSAARLALAERDDQERRAAAAEAREIDRLKASAKRLASWGRIHDNEKFARKAKTMERRIERMEETRTTPSAGNPLTLDVSLGDARSARLLRVESLPVHAGAAADAPVLFTTEPFTLKPGDRVALLGRNGAGKSSLIRTLLAAEADDARIRFSPQCRVGYYDQELAEASAPVSMALWLAERTGSGDERVRASLIHAGFPYARHDDVVGRLSGGERARLLFLVQTLTRPNLLILDEPTNHIDIEGREALEAQLLDTDAAILLTSHDRDFVETVAERFLLLDGGRLREIPDPTPWHAAPERFGAAGGEREESAADRGADGETEDREEQADGDVALARLVELEELLEADRARKPKHQKPERQRAWEAEIRGLYARLES